MIERVGCLLGLLLVAVVVIWFVFVFHTIRGRHACGSVEAEIVEVRAFSSSRGGQYAEQTACDDDGHRYLIRFRSGRLAVGDRVRVTRACRRDGEVLIGPMHVEPIESDNQ
tara:strand:+ start:353 stop:685 length:333 start_codon:yes stop_codon:yes gene_type:complete